MKAMSKYRILAVLLSVFMLGVFLGAGASRWYIKRNFEEFARSHLKDEAERRGVLSGGKLK